MENLTSIAQNLRKDILKIAYYGGGAHIASCYSIVELLTVLYCRILNIDPDRVDDPDRDRFILSKGHASAAIYAILAERGFIEKEQLKTYCQCNSILGGHPEKQHIPGIEASTGSLGHGLSFGAGIAYAGRTQNRTFKTFVMMGDGECQEGSVWEAMMFAAQMKLGNLIAIVDYNKLQAMDTLEKIINLEPLVDKWKSFGWHVEEVDGHDIDAIINRLKKVPYSEDKPTVIIAHTIKGKGISFMENVPIWHYRFPNDDELKIAFKELGIKDREEFLS